MGNTTTRSEEVELGYVSGVFGVRGEVRLFLYNPGSYLMEGEHEVTLRGPSGDRVVRLRARSGAGKRVLGRIQGVDDRDAAAGLMNCRLVVRRTDLPPLEDDEFYVWQLRGARVEVDGAPLGTVTEVHSTGPVELFEIDAGGPEPLFVPALSELVAGVDRDAGVLHLHPHAVEE